MSKQMDGGSSQPELFPRSMSTVIVVAALHWLVVLTNKLDWTELEDLVQGIRMRKLKNGAGRPPRLRALIGAVALRATRQMSYRETEDQIRYYAPARYLCALTETDWSPDANTIQDFEQLIGEEGVKLVNEYTVKLAVAEKLADPERMVADTTAQEAAIPYPNEMGLMAGFLNSVVAASQKAGQALKGFVEKVARKLKDAKQKVREYRLFAKDKTKKAKDKMTLEMVKLLDGVQGALAQALKLACTQKERLTKYGKVAQAKALQLHETMKKLLPQIRYWLKTGYVATGKIISLHIPELYSIVRNKVGKKVEFGLSWGIARLGGGFLLATLGRTKNELVDSKFAIRAVNEHIALFGKAPKAYAYDRGGWSIKNVETLKEKGIKEVGLAPRGKAKWAVHGEVKERLVKERAQVEGGIGALKSRRYGFNRPLARTVEMMGVGGQRAVLGFNLRKLVRELAKRDRLAVVG